MEAKPPTKHVDQEGYEVSTYADGSQCREKTVGHARLLVMPERWVRDGIPQAVIDQGLATMRELGRQCAERREKAFWEAFLNG